MPKKQTKTPTKSRVKTSKRFVLRVVVQADIATTRSEMRAAAQGWLDKGRIGAWHVKSARVTNADIP